MSKTLRGVEGTDPGRPARPPVAARRAAGGAGAADGLAFGPEQDYATGYEPASVAVADVNGDGKPDLVDRNLRRQHVSVLLGNGDGTFQPQPDLRHRPRTRTGVAVADVNGDGKPDLSSPTGTTPPSACCWATATARSKPQASFPAGGQPARRVAVADVNGDGKPDLVVPTPTATT